MVSKAKLFTKLDALEYQLREALLPHLRSAAEGKNDLVFCVTVFNPFRDLRDKTDTLTEKLVEMGAQILSLREKLGEPSDGTIAERICWYCREWSSTGKSYMVSAAGLAKQFLTEIESNKKTTLL